MTGGPAVLEFFPEDRRSERKGNINRSGMLQ